MQFQYEFQLVHILFDRKTSKPDLLHLPQSLQYLIYAEPLLDAILFYPRIIFVPYSVPYLYHPYQ